MAFTGRVTVFSSLAQVRSAAGCRWCEQACTIDAQVTSLPEAPSAQLWPYKVD